MQISALDSSSGVSDQQSVGSNPSHDTCVLKQDTSPSLLSFPMGRKAIGPVLCNAHNITQ